MLMMWSLLDSGLGGATFSTKIVEDNQIPENKCPFLVHLKKGHLIVTTALVLEKKGYHQLA